MAQSSSLLDINSLIENTDIVSYMSQFIELEQKGDEYVAICPFHNEDTPSFTVNSLTRLWYCFGTCHSGGDILTFIQKYHKVDFYSSLKILCTYNGTEMGKLPQTLSILQSIRKYSNLSNQNKKIQYKPINCDKIISFSEDESSFNIWTEEDIPIELMRRYGIKYDEFNNCLSIPIHDNSGNLVNFSNRTLVKDYKRLKIPKYIYSYGWNGGTIDILYNLCYNREIIKIKKEVIIVEGVKSVLKAISYGYDNCIALLTSHLNDFQLKELIKTGAKEFIFALDNGVDIRQDKNILMLKKFGRVTFLHDNTKQLTDKDSPCDCGKELFDELYVNRRAFK